MTRNGVIHPPSGSAPGHYFHRPPVAKLTSEGAVWVEMRGGRGVPLMTAWDKPLTRAAVQCR